MKKTIYIISNGNVLHKKGRRLLLEFQGKRIFEIPCKEIARILLYGRTEITSQTINALLDNGISLYYMKRSGKLKGKIVSPMDHRVHWRYLQFQQFTNPKNALELAIQCITSKLQNMKKIIAHIYRNSRECGELYSPIDNAMRRLKSCGSQEEIMGVEGIATRHYFQIYGQSFPKQFRFATRSRQPATDNTNALLNLGYMTLYREIISHIEAHGLDPYLGFLHALQNGRASLALDILEEFRQPFIDLLVYKIIHKKQIRPEHFVPDKDIGVKISDQGFSIFFKAYEQHLGIKDGENPGIRQVINQQLDLLKQYLEGTKNYQNFYIELE